MNEVRREPLSESDMEMLELAIQTADGRAIHILVDDVQRIIASHRALAARVQAVERDNRTYIDERHELLTKNEALVQQLAEAQGTMAELRGKAVTDVSERVSLTNRLTQAEQQVARLRESLVEYMQLADKICYAEPELTQYRNMKTKASHALRETGAGKPTE